MEAANRLDVVPEDIRAGLDHGCERLILDPEEVGRQDLDGRPWQLSAKCADGRRIVARSAIGHVVTIDRGDDHVREPHLCRRLRESQRLEWVGGRVRTAGVDEAVAARACADVAEDLERRRAATPALRDVRATSLFADRVEVTLADETLYLEVAGVGAGRPDPHPIGSAGPVRNRK